MQPNVSVTGAGIRDEIRTWEPNKYKVEVLITI